MSSALESPERLRRLRELFDAAMEQPAAERLTYLERVETDLELRREVEVLITASEGTDDRTGERLGRIEFPSRDAPLFAAGRRLGAYDIVRLVGRGGMGTVYEAARADDQYHKRVAIKIVQAGLEADLTLARFRRERQILANLDHPNIAALVDGGVTSEGLPFLVMEFVDGEPITTWCDARSLSVRDRISLFRQVCAAVRHAHRNLVVHGDVKPANIFVTGDSAVKLLDFGVAKLLRDETDDAMPPTREFVHAFTREYASPEQIRGEALTTASDVYSLGVVLFELLAGRRPARADETGDRNDSRDSVPRPSAVVTNDDAGRRKERDANRLRQRLRGDLDQIVAKALRETPELRYTSVDALDDDLERFLSNRPVTAQRDRARYRLRKFIRRNRVAVAAAIVAVLALVGGASAAAWQARAARREATKATHISEFLQGILGGGVVSFGSSNRLPQGNLTLREMLDSASRRLPVELAREPLVRAQLHRVIGGGYHASLDPLRARVQFDSAIAIHTRELGPQDLEVARDLWMKGLTVGYIRPDSGEPLVRQALDIYRRQRVADTLSEFQIALLVMAELQLYRVDIAGVDSTVHRLIASEQRRPKPRREVLGFAHGQLGANLRNAGKTDSAEVMMRRGISLFDSSGVGPTYEEAVHLFTFGSLLASRQKNVDALAVLRRAREMAARAIPPSHSIHMQIRAAIADASSASGDTAIAHKEFRAALAMIPSLAKGTEVYGFLVEWRYAAMLRREKLWAEAEQAARRQQASAIANASAFPQYIVDANALLAEVLSDRGKYAEAEKDMLSAYSLAKEKLGDGNVRTTIVRRELARLYLRGGRERDAATLLAMLPVATADSVRREVAAQRGRSESIH